MGGQITVDIIVKDQQLKYIGGNITFAIIEKKFKYICSRIAFYIIEKGRQLNAWVVK